MKFKERRYENYYETQVDILYPPMDLGYTTKPFGDSYHLIQ